MSIVSKHPAQEAQLSGLGRSDLEALLEIAEAATSHLDLEELLRVVVTKVAKVVPVDRCSAILVEKTTGEAVVIASHDVPELRRLPIRVARYPEIRKALESKSAVVVEDAMRDPLMADVRPFLEERSVASLVVAPLVAQGDAFGALFLRLARSTAFGPHEQAFVRAVASTLANSVRNARLHSSVREKRDELQAAYQERYEELVRLNDQLREANRIKDELLAVCSHDLRAPLNVLLGHTRLLQSRMEGTPEHNSISIIERQARRILQLVDRILVRGRGKNAWRLSPRPLDAVACVREIASDLEALGREKDVEIRVSGDSVLRVVADESGLRQILENLVSNAITHTREGTAVELTVGVDATSPDRMRIEVRDRGPGIADDELPLVFERYRRGEGGSGLGLGLAICRELVELHGGDIWASRRQEGGAVFAFTLPIRGGDGEAKTRRLLVVEDGQAQRENLAALLEDGFSLSFAGSGSEGVSRAAALLPDAVVVAAELFPCAEEIRKQPGLGEVPFILFGASRQPDHPPEFLRVARTAEELRALLEGLPRSGRDSTERGVALRSADP